MMMMIKSWLLCNTPNNKHDTIPGFFLGGGRGGERERLGRYDSSSSSSSSGERKPLWALKLWIAFALYILARNVWMFCTLKDCTHYILCYKYTINGTRTTLVYNHFTILTTTDCSVPVLTLNNTVF
jgi:hypothetical protein